MNIGIVILFTGRYNELFTGFYESLKHFKNPHTIYLLTDHPEYYKEYQDVVPLYIQHESYPWVVMHKPGNIAKYYDKWKNHDYILVMQANMRFIKDWEFDAKEPLLLVLHPCQPEPGYILCAMFGGEPEELNELLIWCDNWLKDRENKNNLPEWHDETAVNAFVDLHTGLYRLLPPHTMRAELIAWTHNDYNIIELIHKEKFFNCSRQVYAGGGDKVSDTVCVTIGLTDSDAKDGIFIYQTSDELSLQDVRNINAVCPNHLDNYRLLLKYNKLYKAICEAVNICYNSVLIINFKEDVAIISKSELNELKKNNSFSSVYKKCKQLFNTLT